MSARGAWISGALAAPGGGRGAAKGRGGHRRNTPRLPVRPVTVAGMRKGRGAGASTPLRNGRSTSTTGAASDECLRTPVLRSACVAIGRSTGRSLSLLRRLRASRPVRKLLRKPGRAALDPGGADADAGASAAANGKRRTHPRGMERRMPPAAVATEASADPGLTQHRQRNHPTQRKRRRQLSRDRHPNRRMLEPAQDLTNIRKTGSREAAVGTVPGQVGCWAAFGGF